jgi:hypothetical protein
MRALNRMLDWMEKHDRWLVPAVVLLAGALMLAPVFAALVVLGGGR